MEPGSSPAGRIDRAAECATAWPKRFRAGTHRTLAPEETLRRMLPLLPAFGVTRVADVTGLDHVGIPVCMAVRPASRNLSVLQGKGATLAAAKASAIMEAVESFCAEQPAPAPVRQPLRRGSDERFLLPANLACRELDMEAVIPWVEGIDLLSGRPIFVPEELVRTDFVLPAPAGYGRFVAGSNGIAAGNTRAEALLHAVCELIERDASALWSQLIPAARRATRADPRRAADPHAEMLLGRLDAAGMSVAVSDITSDVGLPCFACLIDDGGSGRPPFLGRFGGSGCHPSAAVALSRALAEAAQSRLTSIVGARDDIPASHYAMVDWGRHAAALFGAFDAGDPATFAAAAASSLDRDTVGEDLAVALECLARVGVARVVAVDLSHSGVPCFRIVADGLEGQHDKPGYRPGPRALRRRELQS